MGTKMVILVAKLICLGYVIHGPKYLTVQFNWVTFGIFDDYDQTGKP